MRGGALSNLPRQPISAYLHMAACIYRRAEKATENQARWVQLKYREMLKHYPEEKCQEMKARRDAKGYRNLFEPWTIRINDVMQDCGNKCGILWPRCIIFTKLFPILNLVTIKERKVQPYKAIAPFAVSAWPLRHG